MEFTREELTEALEHLGHLARAEGKVVELAIYGGSCLALVSNFRIATRDVDAVASAEQGLLDRLALQVAGERGWASDWLNDGVRTYLSPRVDPPEHHALFRAYPSEAEPGLRVFVPTAEYLLAMKLMAMRIGPEEESKDLADILNLLVVVGIQRQDDLIGFAASFYPEARTSAKLRLAIDELWRAREALEAEAKSDPPSYLGRRGPPGE